ncbi:MAG: ABC transporter permease subunit [Oscillospiraceae bacterium]|nr:ABC transporter permease subunit [Oscillospiraceae bacterium]
MGAILKREMSAYFTSPIGYIYLAVFYVFTGYFFFVGTLFSGVADLSPVFSSMFTVLMFLIPVLTMRLMSEEKKQKTDQLLFTSPINLWSLVFGKILAAFCVYLIGLAITIVYGITLSFVSVVDWFPIFANFIGAMLIGFALISIGAFISSLTENQVIAAAGSFAVMIFLMLVDTIGSIMPTEFLTNLFANISFYDKYFDFTSGIVNLSNTVFFLSVGGLFSFFTVRVFLKRIYN